MDARVLVPGTAGINEVPRNIRAAATGLKHEANQFGERQNLSHVFNAGAAFRYFVCRQALKPDMSVSDPDAKYG